MKTIISRSGMANIGIIGCGGNIGNSFMKLFDKQNNLGNFVLISDKDKDKVEKMEIEYDLLASSNEEVISCSDVIVLAVEPNAIKLVCNEINKFCDINSLSESKIIISAAAGVPVSKISAWTNDNHQILRCIPNIPMSAIVWHNPNNDRFGHMHTFIESITQGPKSIWVDDEKLMDPMTVVSGCAPAFVSKIFESYVDIATNMGIEEKDVRALLPTVFSSTSKMLENESGYSVMKQVASKGGATEKGLEELDNWRLKDILQKSADSSLLKIKKITKNLYH